MKKHLSFIILTIVLLAAVLISLSCNGTPPTNNTVTNRNNTSAQSNMEQSVLTKPDCGATTSEKPKAIQAGVEKNIKADDKLRWQYGKNFMFEPIVNSNGNIDFYIWGKVYITDNKDIDIFNGAFRAYMMKGCVERIVFKQAPTTSPSPTPSPSPELNQRPAILSDGFEFIACEAPNELCPDGSCRPQGTCDSANPTPPNVNTNTNANMNSNAKTNANR